MKQKPGKKIIVAALLLMGTAAGAPSAFAGEKPADGIRLELGGGAYYSKNNFDRKRDDASGETREGYYLLSVPLTLSWKHYLDEHTYAAPYLDLAVTHDFGEASRNRHYWSNSQVAGVGFRLGTEHSYIGRNGEYLGGLYASLYSEYQVMSSSIDRSKQEIPEDNATENFKSGVSMWYSRSYPVASGTSFWTELWGEFAYHSTSFSQKGEGDYLLATVAPKVGVSFDAGKIAVEPYLKAELVNDFLGKEWNREPWLNYLQYGPGLRIALGKILPGNVYLYAEYLHVGYFDKKQEASDDVRAGVSFWIPIL
jgi:hypothetical protein